MNAAQRAFDAAAQTPLENINANANILRNLDIAPESTITQLQQQAIQHAQSLGHRAMAAQEIIDQLQRIASTDDFAARSAELTDAWSSAGGLEAVEPILRFMEQHPAIDFGMPGPLVHFVERFYGKGYEEKLIESVRRKPTSATVWMLNRVTNGTKTRDVKQRLIATMEGAKLNPHADQNALQRINRFLERLSHWPTGQPSESDKRTNFRR